jgi:hypothetical protein
LRVNESKSGVHRPWERKFLGYSMTMDKKPRLKVAPEVLKRLKYAVREICRRGRGRSLRKTILALAPKLRGFAAYFRLCEVSKAFDNIDKWIRRKLRCLIWKHWKHPATRVKRLMQRGLDRERAKKSAYNGRGPWWNSNAPHMWYTFTGPFFATLGLVTLRGLVRRFQCNA